MRKIFVVLVSLSFFCTKIKNNSYREMFNLTNKSILIHFFFSEISKIVIDGGPWIVKSNTVFGPIFRRPEIIVTIKLY